MPPDPPWLQPYLDRLGVERPRQSSVDSLFVLHRAQLERVAYENIDIMLGRPPGIDPVESIERILTGRGGYCFTLNGALATLLTALGYDVAWHLGCVHEADESPRPEHYGNHLAVTVRVGGQTWMVDSGLGNAHHEPIPLRAGKHEQGPFTFGLERLDDIPDGWRFAHDPALKSFYAMDFTLAPVRWTDLLPHHAELSTGAQSPFLRLCQVHRRDARGVDSMLNCTLYRCEGGSRTEREITSSQEWFDAATDLFGLRLGSLTDDDRAALWRRMQASQQAWLAARAQAGERAT